MAHPQATHCHSVYPHPDLEQKVHCTINCTSETQVTSPKGLEPYKGLLLPLNLSGMLAVYCVTVYAISNIRNNY